MHRLALLTCLAPLGFSKPAHIVRSPRILYFGPYTFPYSYRDPLQPQVAPKPVLWQWFPSTIPKVKASVEWGAKLWMLHKLCTPTQLAVMVEEAIP